MELVPFVRESVQELCGTCYRLFRVGFLNEPSPVPDLLPTWAEIQARRRCQLCRLVKRSMDLSDVPADDLDPDEPLRLASDESRLSCEVTLGYDGDDSGLYSNRYDLELLDKRYRGKPNYIAYRAIIYQRGSRARGIIQRISAPDWGPIPFFGRYVEPTVDWALINEWLKICLDSHEGSCNVSRGTASRLPAHFRLIDIEKKEIILAPLEDDVRFVALSYVWGEDTAELARYNHKLWRRDVDECGGAVLPSRLPPTIDDAILVTRRLGLRYLWVDALCIVQNDERDQWRQARCMDAVYDHAFLTIAAASGTHCAAGLAGVRPERPRRIPQDVEVIDGDPFAVVMPGFGHLMSAGDGLFWNSRGWTLQEKLFSRRLLLFTEFQVYFRCANAVWQEDTRMEYRRLSGSAERRSSPFRWAPGRRQLEARARPTSEAHHPGSDSDGRSGMRGDVESIISGTRALMTIRPRTLSEEKLRRKVDAWVDRVPAADWPAPRVLGEAQAAQLFDGYAATMAEYTSRDLGRLADGLVAVRGILWSLDSESQTYLAGLPVNVLPQTLLWQPKEGSEMYRLRTLVDPRRDPRDTSPDDIEAPTWSWARWRIEDGCFWEPDLKVPRTATRLQAFDAVDQHRRHNHVQLEQAVLSAGYMIEIERTNRPQLARLDIGRRLPAPPALARRRRPGGGDEHPEDIVARFAIEDGDGRCVGETLTTDRERSRPGPTCFVEICRGESRMERSLRQVMSDVDESGPVENLVRQPVGVVFGLLIRVDDAHNAYRVAVGKVFEESWRKMDRWRAEETIDWLI